MKHPDMNDTNRDKSPKPTSDIAKPEAFDLWLKRGLHQIYDDIANEPIPEDLRKLIEDDRHK